MPEDIEEIYEYIATFQRIDVEVRVNSKNELTEKEVIRIARDRLQDDKDDLQFGGLSDSDLGLEDPVGIDRTSYTVDSL